MESCPGVEQYLECVLVPVGGTLLALIMIALVGAIAYDIGRSAFKREDK